MAKIKGIFLSLLVLLEISGIFFLPTEDASAARPSISADNKAFDILTGSYVLTGNVRVEIGQRIITADKATVNLLSMEVVGEGHINLSSEEDDITFSGDRVTVIGPEKTAYVTGYASFNQGETSITADDASYNWQTKLAVFSRNICLTLNGNRTNHDSLIYHVINRTVEDAYPPL